MNEKLNLFSEQFLDEKIEKAVETLFESAKNNAVLSISGGADSTVINALIKMYRIPVNTVFFNKTVECNHNKRQIKKQARTYNFKIEAKVESYSSITNRLGFPIKNKEFSKMCYRLRGNPLNKNNLVDKFRLITGVSPFKIGVTKVSSMFSLPLKYWYFAMNYPVQEKCCDILKKRPAKKVKRDMIVGIMKSDSPARRRAIKANFHGSFFPLEDWDKKDVFEFLHRFNIDYSNEYKDRRLNDNTYIVGKTNTGCTECHFGQNTDHFIVIDGKKIKGRKFDIMKLEKPKAHARMMKREHAPTGITYEEVIEAYDLSTEGFYLKESAKIRNEMILGILELGKDVLNKDARNLIMTYFVEDEVLMSDLSNNSLCM